jgi:hypothetical protein
MQACVWNRAANEHIQLKSRVNAAGKVSTCDLLLPDRAKASGGNTTSCTARVHVFVEGRGGAGEVSDTEADNTDLRIATDDRRSLNGGPNRPNRPNQSVGRLIGGSGWHMHGFHTASQYGMMSHKVF